MDSARSRPHWWLWPPRFPPAFRPAPSSHHHQPSARLHHLGPQSTVSYDSLISFSVCCRGCTVLSPDAANAPTTPAAYSSTSNSHLASCTRSSLLSHPQLPPLECHTGVKCPPLTDGSPRAPPQPTSTGCAARACAAWAVDVLTPAGGSPAGPARGGTAAIFLRVSWPAAGGNATAMSAGNYTVAGSFLYRDPAVARVESMYPASRPCSIADGAAVTVAIRVAGVSCASDLSVRFLLPAAASALAPAVVVEPNCADLPAATAGSGSGSLLILAAPPHGRAGTATVEILAGSSSARAIAVANFTYSSVFLALTPADVPAGAGGLVNATVCGWGGGGDGWGAAAVLARISDGDGGVERVAIVEFVETVNTLTQMLTQFLYCSCFDFSSSLPALS